MYGLNRLNHLRALFTAAAAPSPIRLLRLNAPLGSFAFTHSSCSPAAIDDDFVYVAKGYKICTKDEIEAAISNNHNNQRKMFQKMKKKNTYKRKVLPPRNVVRLTCETSADGGTCDVYLVGVSHASLKSMLEVEAVIKFLKPQVVFLELAEWMLWLFGGN